MTIVNLYRYDNEDGSYSISPIQRNPSDIPVGVRLIADEGKDLVKGDIRTKCIDTDTADGWSEVDEEDEPVS